MNGLLGWFRRKRVLKGTAFLVAFVLLAHSFDNCSAHVAGLAEVVNTSSMQRASQGCHTPECTACHPTPPHRDACEVTSEVVTLPSSGSFELPPPVLVSTSFVAPAPDIISLMPVACAFASRAGPDVPALSSTLCRNPLQGRAPPVWA